MTNFVSVQYFTLLRLEFVHIYNAMPIQAENALFVAEKVVKRERCCKKSQLPYLSLAMLKSQSYKINFFSKRLN